MRDAAALRQAQGEVDRILEAGRGRRRPERRRARSRRARSNRWSARPARRACSKRRRTSGTRSSGCPARSATSPMSSRSLIICATLNAGSKSRADQRVALVAQQRRAHGAVAQHLDEGVAPRARRRGRPPAPPEQGRGGADQDVDGQLGVARLLAGADPRRPGREAPSENRLGAPPHRLRPAGDDGQAVARGPWRCCPKPGPGGRARHGWPAPPRYPRTSAARSCSCRRRSGRA